MASVNNANTYHNFLRGTELYYGNKKVRPILPFMIKKKKSRLVSPSLNRAGIEGTNVII